MTLSQLTEKVNSLAAIVDAINTSLVTMQRDINSRARLSDLSSTETEIGADITTLGETISNLEKKLAKVFLPEETRFYLEEGEVGDFKANFAKLKSMIAKFEEMYRNLVAYSVSRAGS